MGFLVTRSSNGVAKSYSGTQYANPTVGTKKLCLRTGSGKDDVVKYGLTTDSSASEYCGIRMMIKGNTAYIGRYEQDQTVSSFTTSGTTYTNTQSYNGYTVAKGTNAAVGNALSSKSASPVYYTTMGSSSTSKSVSITLSGGISYSTTSEISYARSISEATISYTSCLSAGKTLKSRSIRISVYTTQTLTFQETHTSTYKSLVKSNSTKPLSHNFNI